MPAICLVNGRHTNPEFAAECPLLGRTKAERLAKYAETLKTPRSEALHGDSSPLNDSHPVPVASVTDGEVSMTRRGGRPRKHASDRIAQREASRAYRARRKLVTNA